MHLRRRWHGLWHVVLALACVPIVVTFSAAAVTFDESGAWTEQTPASPLPAPRLFHAMAEVGDEEILLFGGADVQSGSLVAVSAETWLYDAGNDKWTEMSPAQSPDARYEHAMASLGGGKALLFGGTNTAGGLDSQTWIYDRIEDAWTLMTPPISPSARTGHAMANIGGDRALLFGGMTGEGVLADTWVYDLSENTWTALTPPTSPSARAYHAMAYLGNDWVLLFGGIPGHLESGEPCPPETWIFDLSAESWGQEGINDPPGRFGMGMAGLGFVHAVLFGGEGDSSYGDTVIFDAEATWSEVFPPDSPGLRLGHDMASLSESRVLLFGGWNGTNVCNDTWIYETEAIPAIIVSPSFGLETDENGRTATFTVRAATSPATDITVPLSSSDPSEGTTPAFVVLPAGSTEPVAVMITGLSDDLTDGDVVYTIVTGDPSGGNEIYDAMEAGNVDDVVVTNLDTDAPRMEVLGKDTVIANGDTTPSSTDGTRFESTPRGTRVSQTFSIRNIGEMDLELTGAAPVTLAGSSDFAVTSQPSATILAQGETAEFTIQCRPSGEEASLAAVAIASNDAANPYAFTIRCTGTTAPEITLFGNGRIIPNGDVTPSAEEHTEFTSVGGLTVTQTFEIENSGTEELLLSGGPDYVTVDHPQFEVSRQPEREIGAGQTETFDVTFHPSGTGTIEATVRIGNSDPDEDPYEFLIRGISPNTEGPWPDAGPDRTAGVGERVVLDGSGSRALASAPVAVQAEPQSVLTYRWAFATRSVDGGSPTFLFPAGSQCIQTCQGFDRALASFVPDKEGDYTLTLTVTDAQGRTATDEVTITATWNPGSSEFRVDEIICAPNPFSASVTVRFEGSGIPDRVELSIFDLTGARVWHDTVANTASLSWNGRTSDSEPAPNGPYIAVVVFTGNGQIYTERIILFLFR